VTETLLTNARTAQLLGVGTATLKRWADQGVLPCTRTAGGHRRFLLQDVVDFRARHAGVSSTRTVSEEESLLGTAMAAPDARALAGHLMHLQSRAGAWKPVLELAEQAWELCLARRDAGTLTGLEERLTTERLVRALAMLTEQQVCDRAAPPALLLATEGEPHVVPLALAELGLRSSGQPTQWAGQRTPLPSVTRSFRTLKPARVVVLATRFHKKPAVLASHASLLGNVCRVHGVELTLLGAWPGGAGVVRRAANVAG
jgi:excisionase family DNA binding protein